MTLIIPGNVKIRMKTPMSRMAGKPTAIMFSEGAERVITPKPMLTNSNVIITGSANRRPPVKIWGEKSTIA